MKRTMLMLFVVSLAFLLSGCFMNQFTGVLKQMNRDMARQQRNDAAQERRENYNKYKHYAPSTNNQQKVGCQPHEDCYITPAGSQDPNDDYESTPGKTHKY